MHEFQLSPRLVICSLGGDTVPTSFGANGILVAGREGTLVVDPLVAPGHGRLLAEVAARRDLPPVRWVVSTHHHTDHVLGAAPFIERGAVFLAHRRAAELMALQHPAILASRAQDPALRGLYADARPCRPEILVDDACALELGDLRVELIPLGPAHSPGDLAVVIPSEAAVCCGDLVFAGYHANLEEADAAGIRRALARLAALGDRGIRHVIPGHGPVGDLALVAAQAAYHDELERIAASADTTATLVEAVRARWPGWRLEQAIETAFPRA